MAYKRTYNNKSSRRVGKAASRRRPLSTSTRYNSKSVDKIVDAKVKRAVARVNRGPPRSISVKLKPALFDRSTDIPSVVPVQQWTSFIAGPSSARKYAILPITELVPSQRPQSGEADDRFRSFDKVLVKGVSLRLTVNHAEGCRLLVFAFRNGVRREHAPSSSSRPHVDVAKVSEDISKDLPTGLPVSELYYDVMTKSQLMGIAQEAYGLRHLGVHDGPFDVKKNVVGLFDWNSTDESAFTSRFNKDQGRPVGTIHAKLDSGVSKKHGKTYKAMFGTASLMRTFGYDGQNPNVAGWISTRTRQIDLFIKLNQKEKFTMSRDSMSVNERPLELFVGFDSPGALHESGKVDIASGAIKAMDIEVYYE
jgi:hypothetical protein